MLSIVAFFFSTPVSCYFSESLHISVLYFALFNVCCLSLALFFFFFSSYSIILSSHPFLSPVVTKGLVLHVLKALQIYPFFISFSFFISFFPFFSLSLSLLSLFLSLSIYLSIPPSLTLFLLSDVLVLCCVVCCSVEKPSRGW